MKSNKGIARRTGVSRFDRFPFLHRHIDCLHAKCQSSSDLQFPGQPAGKIIFPAGFVPAGPGVDLSGSGAGGGYLRNRQLPERELCSLTARAAVALVVHVVSVF